MTRRRDTLHASAGVQAQLEKRASLYDAAAPDETARRPSARSPEAPARQAAVNPPLDRSGRKQSVLPPPPQTGYVAADLPEGFGGMYRQASLGPNLMSPLSFYTAASPAEEGDAKEQSSESSLSSPRDAPSFPSLNERYQRALEALDAVESEGGGGFEQRLERLSALVEAAKSFFATALDYARVIISEAFLPEHLRTVKPTKVSAADL